MKTQVLILVLLSISIVSLGQPVEDPYNTIDVYTLKSTDVKTPKGTNIESLKYEYSFYNGQVYIDWTNEYIEAYRETFENNPINFNKVVMGDVTKTYNCHSYAWNVCEGGNNIHWINAKLNSQQSGDGNLANYWGTNGGYTQISGINYAAKIYYSDGDHSARVVTPSTGTVISKWGNKLLVEHPYNDCPYTMTNLKYYKLNKPTISNNSTAICNNSQRTVVSDISDANFTYGWSVSSYYLNEISGDGTPFYTVEGTSNIGYSTIYLTVTTPSGATVSTHDYVGINTPYPGNLSFSLLTTNGTPVSYMCPETHYHIYINNDDGCSLSNYNWSIPSAWTENYTWGNMISVYTGSTPGGMVEVYANTCCGIYTKVFIDYLPSGYCGSSYSMILSPNPTTGETTLSIETTSEDSEFDENAEWELEVYSPAQLLKEKKNNLRGKSAKIQTSGWTEGIYMVRVKYKDEVLQGKLVVKR